MSTYNIAGVRELFNQISHKISLYSFSTGENMEFAAMLTNFSDNYKSDWSPVNILGRMDPIATFKATSRKISVAFDIPNGSAEDAVDNLNEIDKLIKGLYPTYEMGKLGTRNMAGPPFFKIKFSNLVMNATKTISSSDAEADGLLGYLDGFEFKPELDAGVFIIGEAIYPKLLKVSFGFNVIHEHLLGSHLQAPESLPTVSIVSFSHKYKDILDYLKNIKKAASTASPSAPEAVDEATGQGTGQANPGIPSAQSTGTEAAALPNSEPTEATPPPQEVADGGSDLDQVSAENLTDPMSNPTFYSSDKIGSINSNPARSFGVNNLNAPDFAPGVRTYVPTEALGEPPQVKLPPITSFDTGAPAQPLYFARKSAYDAQQKERGQKEK